MGIHGLTAACGGDQPDPLEWVGLCGLLHDLSFEFFEHVRSSLRRETRRTGVPHCCRSAACNRLEAIASTLMQQFYDRVLTQEAGERTTLRALARIRTDLRL